MERSYPLKPWWDPSTAILWKLLTDPALAKSSSLRASINTWGFISSFCVLVTETKHQHFVNFIAGKTTFHLKDFQIVAGVICGVASGQGCRWRQIIPRRSASAQELGGAQPLQTWVGFVQGDTGVLHTQFAVLPLSSCLQCWGCPGWPGLPSPLIMAVGQYQAAEGWWGPNPAHLPVAA